MLKVLNGFFRVTFLGSHHAEIVPGLWVVRAQLYGLFEVLARLLKVVSSEAESSEVVIAFWIAGFGGDDLLKRFCRLVEVAVLEQGYAIGKVVALERALLKHTF